jgi:hypothetical protein
MNSSPKKNDRPRSEVSPRDDAGHDRIDAPPGIRAVGDVGAEQDERRVGDVNDIEHAERDRHAD